MFVRVGGEGRMVCLEVIVYLVRFIRVVIIVLVACLKASWYCFFEGLALLLSYICLLAPLLYPPLPNLA